MTLRSDAKFEEKLTLVSKIDMRNLVDFNGSSGKYENLHFDVLLLSEVYFVEAKKIQRSSGDNTEKWCKTLGGFDKCFEKWHEQFGEFWSNTPKSQNVHFNGLLLTKVHNVWAKKLQRKYGSWHWIVMQYLMNNNWLVVWKMT